MTAQLAPVPVHVPRELIVDFDYCAPPDAASDVHLAWHRLHAGPAIVWTPHHGGHWIATRAEIIEHIQRDHENFSHTGGISLPLGLKPVRYVPLEADPPEHTGFRQLLNPSFAPANIARLEAEARELTIRLIERLRPRGKCEFVADFARHLPVTIFLRLVDLPLTEREQFLQWVDGAIRTGDVEARRAGFARIAQYLGTVIAERKANPGEDLLSRISHAQVRGRPMSDQETLGMALVLFVGGLDTVVNMLTFFALFLARHPQHRQQLIDDPQLIPNAVEELVRRHGLTNTVRTVARDFEFHGVSLRRGDIIQVPTVLHGTDEQRFADPLTVDFKRANLQQHATFGNGPHRCIGAALARAELKVFLQEWLKRIPHFRISEGATVRTLSGNVDSVESLPLTW